MSEHADDSDRDEILRRFGAKEPVEGIAFLEGDRVRVLSGPHEGSSGTVVSLEAHEPEPRYRVRLDPGGEELSATQIDLLPDEPEDAATALGELQRWYASQCDGEWEDEYSIDIRSLDNPGWRVRIPVEDTELEGVPFDEIDESAPERAFFACRVTDGYFEGFGGPHMLGRILRTFLNWADAVSVPPPSR